MPLFFLRGLLPGYRSEVIDRPYPGLSMDGFSFFVLQTLGHYNNGGAAAWDGEVAGRAVTAALGVLQVHVAPGPRSVLVAATR
jgi:hypothetical protein